MFAPSRGVQLVGKVTYVGPDHVGLSVFNVFHATLPIEPVRDFYAYENKISHGECIRKWRILRTAVGFQEDVTVGRQMRFVVDTIKASQSGLFQILASLNEALWDVNTQNRMTLGVLPKEEEISLQLETADGFPLNSAQNGMTGDGQEDTLSMRIMPIGKKSSATRARSALSALQASEGDVGVFGDVLTPSVPVGGGYRSAMGRGDAVRPSGDKRSKKKEKKRKSVKFEDKERGANGEPQHAITEMDSVAPVLTQAYVDIRAEKRARKKEKVERKRNKRENDIAVGGQENAGSSAEKSRKKKKKKRKSSQDGTTAVQLLFGAGSHNGRAKEEDKRRKEPKEVLIDMGGSRDTKEEQGLFVEEGVENMGDFTSHVRQNGGRSMEGGRADGRGVSQASEEACAVGVRVKAQENPIFSGHNVKEEDDLSVDEKESATPTPNQNMHATKGTGGQEASLVRSRHKKLKRKRERSGVDLSSEERKQKRKKRKRKYEDQLA